jgi:hypothetical protein
MAKPAQPAAAQKVYILHKKPSLSGTLCAKPPPRACSIPVRASQSILRAVVSDARTSDFKHAPVGGYGETQPPSRADDAVGPGWNGLQQASDRARRRKIIEVRDVPRLFHHAPDRRRPSQI